MCFFQCWLFRKLSLRWLILHFYVEVKELRFANNHYCFEYVWVVSNVTEHFLSYGYGCCFCGKFSRFGTHFDATRFIFKTFVKIASLNRHKISILFSFQQWRTCLHGQSSVIRYSATRKVADHSNENQLGKLLTSRFKLVLMQVFGRTSLKRTLLMMLVTSESKLGKNK